MQSKIKTVLFFTAIPLLVGTIAGLLTRGSMETFSRLNQPPLSPPGILFPIVWTILYTLMGISSYLIDTAEEPKEKNGKNQALLTYRYQLIVNFLWPVFFFNFQWYLFSFLWLALLWLLVAKMILEFGAISRTAALLNVPYLLWLSFAGYLNLGIWLLN